MTKARGSGTDSTVSVTKSGSAIVTEETASVHTAPDAERSQNHPHALGRRGQLRGRSRPPRRLLLSARRHQLTNENSLQAAVAHAFPQPAATREPGGFGEICP